MRYTVDSWTERPHMSGRDKVIAALNEPRNFGRWCLYQEGEAANVWNKPTGCCTVEEYVLATTGIRTHVSEEIIITTDLADASIRTPRWVKRVLKLVDMLYPAPTYRMVGVDILAAVEKGLYA